MPQPLRRSGHVSLTRNILLGHGLEAKADKATTHATLAFSVGVAFSFWKSRAIARYHGAKDCYHRLWVGKFAIR